MPEPKLLSVINKTHTQKVYEELTAQGALAKKLNARRDIDTTHDFPFWEAKDSVINDWSAFNALHNQVLTNRAKHGISSFVGDKNFDYDNMSSADIQYYEDFLGGIFKKIGHAVGKVGTDIGHGARSVALATAHGVRDVAVGAAHDVRDVQGDMNKEVLKLHSEEDKQIDKILKDVGHGVETGLKAAEPYWKVIATAVVVAALCYTGVGIPIALAIGSATLTGLDSIKAPTPYLAPQAGDGGGEGGADDSGDGGDDSGDGTSDQPNDQSQRIQQQQAQAQAEADAQAAQQAHALKKKVIYISLAVVAVIGIVWWYKKHK